MDIFGIHFHSWKSVMVEREYIFEGEKLTRYVEVYRICKECDVVQEYSYNSQGGSWDTLRLKEQAIVKMKIHNKKFVLEK